MLINHPNKQQTLSFLAKVNLAPFPISPIINLEGNKESKQPCYFDNGRLTAINWKSYTKWYELDGNLKEALIRKWHENGNQRIEGVQSSAGFNGTHYILYLDFDLKGLSPEALSERIEKWIEDHPQLAQCPRFRTKSGGQRLMLTLETNPNINGNKPFSLCQDGEQIGELIGQSGLSIMPPTIGSNGQAYEWIYFEDVYPPVFESLDGLSIYPLEQRTHFRLPSTAPSEKNGHSPYDHFIDNLMLPAAITVDLLSCLSKANREAFLHGASEGNRNQVASTLALDLVGTENYLLTIGQRYEGNALTMLEEFCNRCNPPMTDREAQAIYRSSCNANPNPCLSETMIKNCIGSQMWKQEDKGSKLPKNYPASKDVKVSDSKPKTSQKASVVESSEPSSLSNQEISNALRQIYNEVRGAVEIRGKLVELSKQSGMNFNDIKNLYREVAEELQKEQEKIIGKEIFADVIQVKSTKLNSLDQVFPPELAEMLSIKADSLQIDPLRFLSYMFPTIATAVGSKLYMNGKRHDIWHEDFVIFSADIARPSSAKSQIMKSVTKYYDTKQNAEIERYQAAVQHYEQLVVAWRELSREEKEGLATTEQNPVVYAQNHLRLKMQVFKKGTIEGFAKKLSEQDKTQGHILTRDELSGLFESLNQYKSGGDDRQFILEAFDGRLNTSWTLKGSQIVQLNGQTLNIVGGLQLDLVRKYFNLSNDPDGLASRFLYYSPRDKRQKFVDLASDITVIDDVLRKIEGIEIPFDTNGNPIRQGLHFDDPAYKFWSTEVYEHLTNLIELNQITNPAYASYCGKLRSYFLRLSGLIHLVDWTYNEHLDPFMVSLSAAQRALMLIDYHAQQFLLIQKVGDASSQDKLEGIMADIWSFTERHGFITSRQILRQFNRKVNGQAMNSKLAKEILTDMASIGFGEISEEGGSFKLLYKRPQGVAGVTSSDTPTTPLNSLLDKDLGQVSQVSQEVLGDFHFEEIEYEVAVFINPQNGCDTYDTPLEVTDSKALTTVVEVSEDVTPCDTPTNGQATPQVAIINKDLGEFKSGDVVVVLESMESTFGTKFYITSINADSRNEIWVGIDDLIFD